MASSREVPYTKTPGRSGTSAIHLPSSSRSRIHRPTVCHHPPGAVFGRTQLQIQGKLAEGHPDDLVLSLTHLARVVLGDDGSLLHLECLHRFKQSSALAIEG